MPLHAVDDRMQAEEDYAKVIAQKGTGERVKALQALPLHRTVQVYSLMDEQTAFDILMMLSDKCKAILLMSLSPDVRDGILNHIPEAKKFSILSKADETSKSVLMFALLGGQLTDPSAISTMTEWLRKGDNTSGVRWQKDLAEKVEKPDKPDVSQSSINEVEVDDDMDPPSISDNSMPDVADKDGLLAAIAAQKGKVSYLRSQLESAEEDLEELQLRLRMHNYRQGRSHWSRDSSVDEKASDSDDSGVHRSLSLSSLSLGDDDTPEQEQIYQAQAAAFAEISRAATTESGGSTATSATAATDSSGVSADASTSSSSQQDKVKNKVPAKLLKEKSKGMVMTPEVSMKWEVQALADVAARIRDPLSGVKQDMNTYRLKTYHNTFVGQDAVDWMVKHTNVNDRSEAVMVLGRLQELGYLHHVPNTHAFKDSNHHFFRFAEAMPTKLSLQVLPLPKGSHGLCSQFLNHLLQLIKSVHEGNLKGWLNPEDRTVRQYYLLRAAYPILLLYARLHPEAKGEITSAIYQIVPRYPGLRLPLLGFQRANGGQCLCPVALTKEAMKQTEAVLLSEQERATMALVTAGRPGSVGRKYEKKGTLVSHPLNGASDLKIEVKKVFASAAKPAWIRFVRTKDEQPKTEEEIKLTSFPGQEQNPAPLGKAGDVVYPDVVAKAGDDLRKDLAVQLIFKVFEAVWASEDVQWALGRAPYIKTYNIVVAGEAAGFLEFVPGVVVKDIDAQNSWKDIDLLKFAPSAVGSMIGGFVLGVRDRHSENWMLVGDRDKNPELMQIDFGYMLMENPGGFPLDTPRLTMSKEIIQALEETQGLHSNLLHDLRRDLVTAYRILRKHQHSLISFIKVALSNMYDIDKVEKFLRGKHSFRSDLHEEKALEWFDGKVHSQLKRSNMRRAAKHALVKGFYAFQKLTGT